MSGCRFKVYVAEDIQNVQTFGSQVCNLSQHDSLTFPLQNPYVRATLLPGAKSQSKTLVDNGGGTSPSWNTNVRLKDDHAATALLLEVMNENMMLDEVIGQVS